MSVREWTVFHRIVVSGSSEAGRRKCGAEFADIKELFGFLEERKIPYIVVARFTKCVKREVTRIANWRALDEDYAVGECEIKLMGWDRAWRFVAVRDEGTSPEVEGIGG